MSTPSFCPQCGELVGDGLPAALCPTCLMRLGVDSIHRPSDMPDSLAQTTDARFQAPAVNDLQRLIPGFEFIKLVGQGGMGAVYQAKQKTLGRIVAIKVLPVLAAGRAGFSERFEREAQAMAKLSHANIVSVYDSARVGDLCYFVMEFVDGPNLRDLMQGSNVGSADALNLVQQVCQALQYAHDCGVVHRDIKPENILVGADGVVKIADFGLAKLVNRPSVDLDLTHSRMVMGTPKYMSPEQIESPLNVDHRADIYSLGVVFYELLTGDLPLGQFLAPSEKASVDVRLDEVVLRSLAKEPERRYQHASDIKKDVDTIVQTPEAKERKSGGGMARQIAGVLIIAGIIGAAIPMSKMVSALQQPGGSDTGVVAAAISSSIGYGIVGSFAFFAGVVLYLLGDAIPNRVASIFQPRVWLRQPTSEAVFVVSRTVVVAIIIGGFYGLIDDGRQLLYLFVAAPLMIICCAALVAKYVGEFKRKKRVPMTMLRILGLVQIVVTIFMLLVWIASCVWGNYSSSIHVETLGAPAMITSAAGLSTAFGGLLLFTGQLVGGVAVFRMESYFAAIRGAFILLVSCSAAGLAVAAGGHGSVALTITISLAPPIYLLYQLCKPSVRNRFRIQGFLPSPLFSKWTIVTSVCLTVFVSVWFGWGILEGRKNIRACESLDRLDGSYHEQWRIGGVENFSGQSTNIRTLLENWEIDRYFKTITSLTLKDDPNVHNLNVSEILEDCPHLEVLTLRETNVADGAMENVARLKKLKHLNVGGTGITDAGLYFLQSADSLRYISVANTDVTEEGAKRFTETCPWVNVNRKSW